MHIERPLPEEHYASAQSCKQTSESGGQRISKTCCSSNAACPARHHQGSLHTLVHLLLALKVGQAAQTVEVPVHCVQLRLGRVSAKICHRHHAGALLP